MSLFYFTMEFPMLQSSSHLVACKYHNTLQWRHNGCDGVSDHQPHDCLRNRLFRRKSNKTSKLRVTDLCAGTSEFPAQMVSNTENVSIWWCHHEYKCLDRPSAGTISLQWFRFSWQKNDRTQYIYISVSRTLLPSLPMIWCDEKEQDSVIQFR